MEICEQVGKLFCWTNNVFLKSFRKVNKWKFTTRYLTVFRRLFFLKILDDERNMRYVKYRFQFLTKKIFRLVEIEREIEKGDIYAEHSPKIPKNDS